jgi:rsbT antagonist protein RsbS
MKPAETLHVPLQLSRGVLVASLQLDLSSSVLEQFRVDLLEFLSRNDASGVLIDVSGIEILDADDFDDLRRTAAMARLMGVRTVIAGLRPGVVSALVDLGVDGQSLETALNLDDGFDLLKETSL